METDISYVQYLFLFGIVVLFLYGYILHSLQRKHQEFTFSILMQIEIANKEHNEQILRFIEANTNYISKLESTANNAIAALAYAVEKGKSDDT